MYFYCYDYIFLLYFYVCLPWLRFFRASSSVVRQMPGWNLQRRGTARTLPNFCVVLCIYCVVLSILCCSMYFCVVLCIVCFVSFSVLFVCICVLYYCHRVATQLQLNISHHIKIHIQKTLQTYMKKIMLSYLLKFKNILASNVVILHVVPCSPLPAP